MNDSPWLSLENNRQRVNRTVENSARFAQSLTAYKTTGWGEFTEPTVYEFDCTFVDQPYVTSGYALDGDTLVATRFPRVQVGVYKWKQDKDLHYTGAWLFFVVDTMHSAITIKATEPNYEILHSIVFHGIAFKDFPVHLLGDL